jgi:hypothetical protein
MADPTPLRGKNTCRKPKVGAKKLPIAPIIMHNTPTISNDLYLKRILKALINNAKIIAAKDEMS